MIVIFDAIDKSGKTSVIDAIKSQLGDKCQVIKRPKSLLPYNARQFTDDNRVHRLYTEQSLLSQYKLLFEIFKNDKKIILFDRYYPTQIVYSYKRGYDELKEPSVFWDLDEEISKVPHLFVTISESDGTIGERFKREKEEYLSMSDIQTIQERFRTFVQATSLKNILVLEENTSVEERKNLVLQKVFELSGRM